MSFRLNPYVNFRGQAREAVTFYQSVLGGEVELSTFGELGMGDDPATKDLVMHSQLVADDFWLMVSDAPPDQPTDDGSNNSISLSGDDDERLTRAYEGLVEGGRVIEPLARSPWGDKFGMLVDRFGVTWLVNISGPAAGRES